MLVIKERPEIPENYHHPLSASVIKRPMLCPGSVKATAGIVRESGVAAQFGTLVHEYAAALFTEEPIKGEVSAVDLQALKAAQEYIDVIGEVVNGADWKVAETRVYLDTINVENFPTLSGTADLIAVFEYSKLIVIDLKTGYIDVPVKRNKQLSYYALGAYRSLEPEVAAGITHIDLVIVQINPKVGTQVKTYTMPLAELLEFEKEIQAAVIRVEQEPDLLIAGDHCTQTYCPAALNCPALRSYMSEAVGKDLHDLQPGELLPSPTDLSKAMSILETVRSWCKLVDEQALQAELDNPGSVADWKAVASFGHRKFINEEAIKAKAKELGILDKIIVTELKTPAQIEKIKEAKELVSSDTIFRPNNGYKLKAKDENETHELDAFLKGKNNNG